MRGMRHGIAMNEPQNHPSKSAGNVSESNATRIPSESRGEAIERLWYIRPPTVPRRGWLVYSLDFIIASLQGCATNPEGLRRTTGWLILGSIVRFFAAIAQAVLMLLSLIPVISWFVEILARTFTRNAAGFFLRSCYWKARLRTLGQDTIIDQCVDIWGARYVSIGSNCHLDAYVRFKAGERKHGQHGYIDIGNHVHIGPGALIAGRGGITIEDYVSLSASVRLYSATNTIERPDDPGLLISMSHVAPPDRQHTIEAPIAIESYVFLGMKSCVLPGVRIGRGAIIHANCELTRDVPAFANIGGLPRGRQIGWRRPRRTSPLLPQKAGGDGTTESRPTSGNTNNGLEDASE